MEKKGIQSVAKALFLLEEISRHQDGISLKEITEIANLEKSSVFRILETLAINGFIIKKTDPIRYLLGLKLFRLGMSKVASMPFRRLAIPYLQKLRDATGETAVLATIESYDMFYLEVEPCSSIVRCSLDISRVKPVYCDAFGKALLGSCSDAYLDEFFRINSSPETAPVTECGKKKFRESIAAVRETGTALDHEEREPGLCGVALPVRMNNGAAYAALGVIYPSCRYAPEKEKKLIAKTRTVEQDLSRAVCEYMKI